MAAHQPHRLARRGANGRRAEPLDQSPDRALRRLSGLDHPRRQAERPSGGVDQNGAGARLVVNEIALAQLVLDEAVGGAGVGHAQQRLGKNHQRQALLGRERELAQHVLDTAEPVVPRPDSLDQPCRGAVDPHGLRLGPRLGCEQSGRDAAIIGRVGSRKWRDRCGSVGHRGPATGCIHPCGGALNANNTRCAGASRLSAACFDPVYFFMPASRTFGSGRFSRARR